MPYDHEYDERRLQVLWRGKAEDFLRDIRPRTPPSGWAFVGTLQAFLRNRQLDTPIKYDEDETTDWRSFRAWYLKVREDLHKVVELLEDHEKWPCDFAQQQIVIDRGYALKDAYRNWHERGAIKWLPEDHALKTERGREPCTVIEFCANALMSYERIAKGAA